MSCINVQTSFEVAQIFALSVFQQETFCLCCQCMCCSFVVDARITITSAHSGGLTFVACLSTGLVRPCFECALLFALLHCGLHFCCQFFIISRWENSYWTRLGPRRAGELIISYNILINFLISWTECYNRANKPGIVKVHITIRWAKKTNMINLEKNKIIVLNRTKTPFLNSTITVEFKNVGQIFKKKIFFWYEKFYSPLT